MFGCDVFAPGLVVTVQGIKKALVLVNKCCCGNKTRQSFCCHTKGLMVKHAKIRCGGHVVQFGWFKVFDALKIGFIRFIKRIFFGWRVSLGADGFVMLRLQWLFFCRPKFQVMFMGLRL